jgi:hypothetical protein
MKLKFFLIKDKQIHQVFCANQIFITVFFSETVDLGLINLSYINEITDQMKVRY